MFTLRKKGSGNRYTLISILMILVVIYVFRLVSPAKEVSYPDIIEHGGNSYQYAETIKSNPFMFTRKKTGEAAGYLILARRGVDVSEEIYIYEGFLRYRRYIVTTEQSIPVET